MSALLLRERKSVAAKATLREYVTILGDEDAYYVGNREGTVADRSTV